MKNYFSLLLLLACSCVYSSCCDDDDDNKVSTPEIDISEEIIGEWVYDNPIDGAWQSMKFTDSGKFFYSEDKREWTAELRRTDGNYALNGMNVSGYRASGTLYVDMTIQTISDYSFTTRFKNTDLDFTYSKVLMRTHLNFAESVIPPYSVLIDKEIISYKSHDDEIATVDSVSGEITAVARDGRTYIDLTTSEGTACIKVMIGNVNDGDEAEISTIPVKKDTVQIENVDVAKMIVGSLWVYDHPEERIWEIIRFMDSGKLYYSNTEGNWDFENENTSGDYTIDQKTIKGTVFLYGGTVPMDFYWVVTNISDLEFTVKVYSSGEYVGRFTYAKQIGSIELNSNDTTNPDYQHLVGGNDVVVTGYKSHNTSIAEVNSSTGEITAKAGGRTYIDVVTDKGTAVVEVHVTNPILYYNFDEFIWSDRNKVNEAFGEYASSVDGDKITYNLEIGDYKSATFTFENEIVCRIDLTPKNSVTFTNSEMTDVLNERYTPYATMTTKDRKTFLNGNTEEDSNVLIAYYLKTKQLIFMQFKQ